MIKSISILSASNGLMCLFDVCSHRIEIKDNGDVEHFLLDGEGESKPIETFFIKRMKIR